LNKLGNAGTNVHKRYFFAHANPSPTYPMLLKIYTKTNQLAFEAICPNIKTPFFV
jgi:hypothetical protein